MEKILCSAIWYDDGEKHVHQPKNIETGIVVCGMRHHNCIALLKEVVQKIDKDAETFLPYFKERAQGFLTSENRFVDRWQAMGIAYYGRQLLPENDSKKVVFNNEGWDEESVRNFAEYRYEDFINETPQRFREKEECPFRKLFSEHLW